jgi:hypothetical protein
MESKTTRKRLAYFPENLANVYRLMKRLFQWRTLYYFDQQSSKRKKKGTIVAMIAGTKAQAVIAIIEKIPLKLRNTVSEITLDMAANMD